MIEIVCSFHVSVNIKHYFWRISIIQPAQSSLENYFWESLLRRKLHKLPSIPLVTALTIDLIDLHPEWKDPAKLVHLPVSE